MAAGSLNASSTANGLNTNPVITTNRPIRPKGIISKLSSRNRRRRRENRENERIPIPSFSYSSQTNEGESRVVESLDGGSKSVDESSRVQVQTKEVNEKENSPECQIVDATGNIERSKPCKQNCNDSDQQNAATAKLPLVNPSVSSKPSLEQIEPTLPNPSTDSNPNNSLKRKAADSAPSHINLDLTEQKCDVKFSFNSDNSMVPDKTSHTNRNNTEAVTNGQTAKSNNLKKRKSNLDPSHGFVSALQLISSQTDPTVSRDDVDAVKRAVPVKNAVDKVILPADSKKRKIDNSTAVKPNLGTDISSTHSIRDNQCSPLSLDNPSSEPAGSLASCTIPGVEVASTENVLTSSPLMHAMQPAETNKAAEGGTLSTNSGATTLGYTVEASVTTAQSSSIVTSLPYQHAKHPDAANAETAKPNTLSTDSDAANLGPAVEASDKTAKSSTAKTSLQVQHTKSRTEANEAAKGGLLSTNVDATNLGSTVKASYKAAKSGTPVTSLPFQHAKSPAETKKAATLGTLSTYSSKSTPSPHLTYIDNKQYLMKSIGSTSSTPRDDADSSSDVEIVAAPSTKPLKPKSRKSIDTKAGDPNNTDSNQLGLKREKKEPEAKTRKRSKPAASSKKVVIELDDCSTSSSSSDDCLIRKRPLKSTVAKKRSVKVEKKARSKVKNELNNSSISGTTAKENAEPKKSTKKSKPKSARIQNSASSDKKLCFACSSCKCNSRDGTSATPQKPSAFATLSGSNARQEQALINRLQKIERNVQWMESQKADVGRQLMKHRNAMTKKWEAQNSTNSSDRPKFLADVEEWDGVELNTRIDAKEVKRAGNWTFGESKAKATPKKFTLTQHFGSSSNENAETSPTKSVGSLDDDEKHIVNSCVEIVGSLREESESDDEELKRHRTNAHLTSMRDFFDAKQNTRVSNWEFATTAATTMIDNMLSSPCSTGSVNGIDELLRLFSPTLNKSAASPACLHADLDGACDKSEIFPPLASLTPRGKQIATNLVNSITDKPAECAAIERACPDWKDNIEFAQRQTDPEHVCSALMAVREAKSHVEQMKQKIFQALMDRQHTLELFEQSLEKSIERLEK